MNKAVLRVDRHILRRLLLIPEGVELRDLYYDLSTDSLKILVVGDGFPPTPDPGKVLPEIVAEYRHDHGHEFMEGATSFSGFRSADGRRSYVK